MRKALLLMVGIGILLTANAWGVAASAQAQKISVKELMSGPMAQSRQNLNSLLSMFAFPGNRAAPSQALRNYQERVRISSLTLSPNGKRSYLNVLQENGIPQWITQGGSSSLQIVGPFSVSGPNNRPVFCYPAILHLDRGKIHRSLPKRFCVTYADRPAPTIVHVSMKAR